MTTDVMTTDVIMVTEHGFVNPHPMPGADRLARIHDETLARLIVIHVADLAPEPRRHLAGIPHLTDLEQERQRREAARPEVAS